MRTANEGGKIESRPVRRRALMSLLGSAVIGRPHWALADAPAKIYRVGTLNANGPAFGAFEASLQRGLAAHGYEIGRNLALERRGAEGNADRLPELLREIVATNVDVILTFGYEAAFVAKVGTTVPVVVFSAGDPVGTGLVESLARPGGHLTGISDVSAEVTPKRMELLKQFAPALGRVAVLYNAGDLAMRLRYSAAQQGARDLGISIQPLGVREPADFELAIGGMTHDMPDGILMVSDPLTVLHRQKIFDFARAQRLPAIYEYDFLARDGGLMSYGLDSDETFDRFTALTSRILHGAKPAELPFEQPTLFRFALNMKTAKAIGFAVPPSLLAFADEVIE
ncbi:MAG TPA: ABC transporter substrate-binding protein [Acetobacteraceae bacterium]|jgi:putative ABC transport system substrate-binding protein|nr:ABC transporter substrate-binding protein [Acetobacteraceae bacterium]